MKRGITEVNTRKKINMGFLFYCLFMEFFSSSLILSIINIVMPVIITVYSAVYAANLKISILAISVIIIIVFNIISYFVATVESQNKKLDILVSKAYNEQNLINIETSTQIFRMNTHIWKKFEKKESLLRTEICEFINFQKYSFLICKSIYSMLKSEYNFDGFTVTIHQRFSEGDNNEFMKMIAYENQNSKIPNSYYEKFYINEQKNRNYNFVKASVENDDDLIILENKNIFHGNFQLIDTSKKREQEICQYIGIPIKMNSNKVQLVINIDVCSEKVLGKSKKELKQIAESVLISYASNLKLAYEYNITFDKYFDLLERFCRAEVENNEIKNKEA